MRRGGVRLSSWGLGSDAQPKERINPMIWNTYHDVLTHLLDDLESSQGPAIEQAAHVLRDTIMAGHSIFAFGCNHSSLLVQEIYYRAGGFALVNPLFAPGVHLEVEPPLVTSDMESLPGLAEIVLKHSALAAGDVLLVVSTSGRNAVPVEMAERAKARGAYVIALTALAYGQQSESRAPSGHRLHEIADLVFDNKVPPGDAALPIPGSSAIMGPVSTVAGAFLLNALMARTVEILVAEGLEAPVFKSGNLDSGREYNEALFRRYDQQIHYPRA